ncbi:peroxidase-like [Daktulosphaira vitifoliae]|uniref:peroxidase-like n=1 Tax=Daktulosphaira vitifoliae TaxID=58002 RepID=UPI0021A9A086|nr:peroxidase-like [Daktulosphaira vitifoliae]
MKQINIFKSIANLVIVSIFLSLNQKVGAYEDGSNYLSKLGTKDLEAAIQYGISQINMLARYEDTLTYAEINVKTGTPAHGQLIDSKPTTTGHLASRDAEIILKASQYLINKFCLRYGISRSQCAKNLAKVKLDQTSLGKTCLKDNQDSIACDGKSLKYRSADGSCNNKKHSSWGKSNTAYKRLIFPDYGDGINSIKDLPSPRILSNSLVDSDNSPDNFKTLALAFWTIFIGHDLSHTAVTSMLKTNKSVDCCNEYGTKLAPRHTHPACAPIIIPMDDPFFSSQRRTCMNYVRSVPAIRPDCTFGPREQLNQATHFLDASMIYGTSSKQSMSLRQLTGGRLLISSNDQSTQLMPLHIDGSNSCQNGNTCYISGDARVNAQPHLTVMHTLWMREHNRIADQLRYINKNWDDEQIFQEAKKIVTASIQHITYNEWLPALLGNKFLKKNQLELLTNGYSNLYDDNINPSVSNSFATAVLPFANSMINETLGLYVETRTSNSNISLTNHFNNPSDVQINLMDELIRGLTMQNAEKIDMKFSEAVTNHLYSNPDNPKVGGMDVVSLDIQRGRDHGLPSYTQFRKYCGLETLNSFEELSRVMNKDSTDKLLKQYKSVNDVDLIVGILYEKPEYSSMVGPTMKCIIKDQFTRTRKSDRLFYDLPDVFTKQQLAEIRKVTLARVFCDNSDNISTMQQSVFFKPRSTANDLLPCKSPLIPKINLKHWSDLYHFNQ